MPSEKYIEKRVREARSAPTATSFYTEQRKTEYKTMPEALKAQYSGMVAGYKREVLSQALPPGISGREQLEEYLGKEAEKLKEQGAPAEEVDKWVSDTMKKYEEAEAAAQAYAEQRVRSEAQAALATATAIGGITTASSIPVAIGLKGYAATALSGAISGTSGAQIVVGITQGRVLTPEEALISAGIGAAAGVGTEALLEKIITPKASQWLTQRYLAHGEVAAQAATELGPAKGLTEWRTWTDKLVMRLTGAKPYFAPGEVSIPIGETLGPRGYEVIPETLPYTDMGWQLTAAPKTSSVMIPKYATFVEETISISPAVAGTLSSEELKALAQMLREEPMPEDWLKGFTRKSTAVQKPEEYIPKLGSFERKYIYAAPRSGELFFERGYGKMPELQELMREMKLLPFTTQTQVTRLGIHPYIPKNIITPSEEIFKLSTLSGIIPGTVGGLLPKQREEPRKSSLPKPFAFEIEEIKEEAAPSAISIPKVKEIAVVKQKQQQQSVAVAIPKDLVPQRLLPKTIKPSDMTLKPLRGRKTRRGIDLFGWYRWDYPILSPEKLLKGFGLNIRRRRRR